MNTNRSIVNKAGTIETSVVTSGLLQPYQAKKFLQQTFDATPLMKSVRHETKAEKSGEIDKIGIGRRKLRGKVENTDDGYRAKPEFGSIHYGTKPVKLPWEITEETIRQNIEGDNMDNVVTNLMTKQVGVDSEDLLLNGEENASGAEAFSSTAAYKAGDCVTEAGGLYRFLGSHAAGTWNAAEAERIGDATDKVFLGQKDGIIKSLGDGHIIDVAGA